MPGALRAPRPFPLRDRRARCRSLARCVHGPSELRSASAARRGSARGPAPRGRATPGLFRLTQVGRHGATIASGELLRAYGFVLPACLTARQPARPGRGGPEWSANTNQRCSNASCNPAAAALFALGDDQAWLQRDVHGMADISPRLPMPLRAGAGDVGPGRGTRNRPAHLLCESRHRSGWSTAARCRHARGLGSTLGRGQLFSRARPRQLRAGLPPPFAATLRPKRRLRAPRPLQRLRQGPEPVGAPQRYPRPTRRRPASPERGARRRTAAESPTATGAPPRRARRVHGAAALGPRSRSPAAATRRRDRQPTARARPSASPRRYIGARP